MPWSSKSVEDAIGEAKLKGAIFVVYVQDSRRPTKLHEIIHCPEVSDLLESDNFIVINVCSESDNFRDFSKIYQLIPVPSLFFIGQNGRPLEIISSELSQNLVVQRIKNLIQPSEAEPSNAVHSASASDSTPASSEPVLSNLMTPACISSAIASSPSQSDVKANAQCSEQAIETKDEDTSQVLSSQNVLVNEQNQERKTQRRKLSAESLNMDDCISEPNVQPQENVSTIEIKYSQTFPQKRLRLLPGPENQHHSAARLQGSQKKPEIRSSVGGLRNNVDYGGRSASSRASQDYTESRNVASRIPSMPADTVEEYTDSSERWPANAQIQFRLPDGSTHSQMFWSSTTVAELREYVRRCIPLPIRDYILSTSYPRVEFTDELNNTPIGALGLAPRSVILIIPGSEVSVPSRFPAAFGAAWAYILWPFTAMYSLFTYLNVRLFGATDSAVSDTDTTRSRSQQDLSSSSVASLQSSSRNISGARRRVPAPSSVQRDGNVHRLSSRPDDSDEDNNTWNGNSTQQM